MRQNSRKATFQGGGLLRNLPKQFLFRLRWLQNYNVHHAYKTLTLTLSSATSVCVRLLDIHPHTRVHVWITLVVRSVSVVKLLQQTPKQRRMTAFLQTPRLSTLCNESKWYSIVKYTPNRHALLSKTGHKNLREGITGSHLWLLVYKNTKLQVIRPHRNFIYTLVLKL